MSYLCIFSAKTLFKDARVPGKTTFLAFKQYKKSVSPSEGGVSITLYDVCLILSSY